MAGALAGDVGQVRPAPREVHPEQRLGSTYGHGRIAARADAGSEPGERVGGQAAHGIMGEEGLVARVARRRRRHDFYGGEISEAPPNLPRDGRGRHDLGADAPDGRWVTDAAGSRISAGRACLSPIAGRPGGMPPGRCQGGTQPRRCEARGPHRPPRDRALLRVRSGRGCDRRARENARRVPEVARGRQDQERPRL